MYALDREWRRLLGVPAPVSVPLGPADGLDRESWAENEFGGAPLGDKRLTRRLVTSATVQAEHPGSSFVSAAQGRSALVSGYYRMASGRVRRQSRQHSGGASAAHAAAHAGAGRGALRRQRPQLRDPLQEPRQQEQKLVGHARAAHAYHSCSDGLPLGILRVRRTGRDEEQTAGGNAAHGGCGTDTESTI